MNLKHIAITIIGCIPLLISVSCSSKAPYWDGRTSQFHIPDNDIVISLPPNLEWEIADVKNLPDNVSFCGVAPEISLCTFLISEKSKYDNPDIWLYPNEDIQNLIKKISLQNTPDVDVTYHTPKTEKCHYNSRKAIKFSTTIEIDMYSVSYTGYLVSNGDNIYGIVAMEPDSVTTDNHKLALKSIEGLKFTK